MAVAQDYDRVPSSITVSTAGINFRSASDVRHLYGRLERASEAVCDSRMGRDLGAAMADAACARRALDRAVATAHQPLLAALHEHVRMGRPMVAPSDYAAR